MFVITDSGPGIPVSVRQKIMQPFFTAKEVGKRTGMGLSISKTIIETHRGEFSYVADKVNTCFRFSLPKPDLLSSID